MKMTKKVVNKTLKNMREKKTEIKKKTVIYKIDY